MMENLSIARKDRNSNVELFRLFATLLVIMAHFNGWFVGGIPEVSEVGGGSAFRIGQAIIASLCACCVNCFLIITGFFGIRLKTGSVYKLLIQLIGIFVPFYLFAIAVGKASFNPISLIHNFLPISRGGVFC